MWERSKKEAGNVLKASQQLLSVICVGDRSGIKGCLFLWWSSDLACIMLLLVFCSLKQKLVQANPFPQHHQLFLLFQTRA